MPDRRPGRLVLIVLGLALTLITLIAATPADAASAYRRELYFAAGYERQVDSRTCTAASTAMMLNFIARRDLNLDQLTILRYAQPRDALDDRVQRGTDPLGWSRALTHFSPAAGKGVITYRWEAWSSESQALRRAARRLAASGKPIGLLVRGGTHAMVMTGFEASRNPLLGDFRLDAVWISDPLGYWHRRYLPSESPLDRYRELDATATYDKLWYGHFLIVAPSG
jgi:hypothetical protein